MHSRILSQDVAVATSAAIAAGERLLEVEFPPLPSSVSSYKGASDSFIDANIQLALQTGRLLARQGRKVHVLLPDK